MEPGDSRDGRLVRVENHQVSHSSHANLSPGKTKHSRRTNTHQVQQHGQVQDAAVYQLKPEREGCFKPDDAKRSLIELPLLLERGMGSMIGGDHIDRSVPQSLDDRETVFFCPEWRVHLGIRVMTPDSFIRQGKIMGTGFRRDMEMSFFGFPDKSHPSGGRQMGHMQTTARRFQNFKIPCDNDFFRRVGMKPLRSPLNRTWKRSPFSGDRWKGIVRE